MRFFFICVGRLNREYQGVWDHYVGLLRPYARIEVREVPEAPSSMGTTQAQAKEAAQLLERLRSDIFLIAVDPRGTEFSSEGLSAFLAEKLRAGTSSFQFVLGGPTGLSAGILEKADTVWSLSKLTFPHQMARCIVLEQLYRAIRIERGEPYHR
ncbi:MAG: 23S rRNA (pseudouridine(1915)-N(3))-methyltransferase RlmH [Thermoleophilia bacterium]|nr:23S rRNA (pseudouridine(1915)-N(3))-methyltransferase RlmH [Thermoleophilia bacterium]